MNTIRNHSSNNLISSVDKSFVGRTWGVISNEIIYYVKKVEKNKETLKQGVEYFIISGNRRRNRLGVNNVSRQRWKNAIADTIKLNYLSKIKNRIKYFEDKRIKVAEKLALEKKKKELEERKKKEAIIRQKQAIANRGKGIVNKKVESSSEEESGSEEESEEEEETVVKKVIVVKKVPVNNNNNNNNNNNTPIVNKTSTTELIKSTIKASPVVKTSTTKVVKKTSPVKKSKIEITDSVDDDDDDDDDDEDDDEDDDDEDISPNKRIVPTKPVAKKVDVVTSPSPISRPVVVAKNKTSAT